MESKYVFREGKYKLVHTTNNLKDNLLISSSQIEPEIDVKLQKLEVAINNAHQPIEKLRKVVKVLLIVLCVLVVVWTLSWIVNGSDPNPESFEDIFSIKDNQLVEANGRIVKNGFITCTVAANGDSQKVECNYHRDMVKLIEKAPSDESPSISKTTESEITTTESPLEKAASGTNQNEQVESEVLNNTASKKPYEEDEKPKKHEEHKIRKTEPVEEHYETTNTSGNNFTQEIDSESDADKYMKDIYSSYNYSGQKPKNRSHSESGRFHVTEEYQPENNYRYQNYSGNKNSSIYQNYDSNNPYSSASVPNNQYSHPNTYYNYNNSGRRLTESISGLAQEDDYKSPPSNSGLTGENDQTGSLLEGRLAETQLASDELIVNNMPIEIDGKWYRIKKSSNTHRSVFTPLILIVCLLILVLELCIRVISMKTEAYLSKSLAHLVALENKAISPIKIIMTAEYTLIDVKVLGIIEPNRDQELTAEDNLYRTHTDSKHYLERKMNKLQKKVKKNKPKYDNYLNPSDDSLDISMGSEAHLNRKANTEASFVLNTNK